jgi:hypothetical protein
VDTVDSRFDGTRHRRHVVLAQTKPERQSKAAKSAESAAASSTTASNPDESADNDSGKPEEKLSKE